MGLTLSRRAVSRPERPDFSLTCGRRSFKVLCADSYTARSGLSGTFFENLWSSLAFKHSSFFLSVHFYERKASLLPHSRHCQRKPQSRYREHWMDPKLTTLTDQFACMIKSIIICLLMKRLQVCTARATPILAAKVTHLQYFLYFLYIYYWRTMLVIVCNPFKVLSSWHLTDRVLHILNRLSRQVLNPRTSSDHNYINMGLCHFFYHVQTPDFALLTVLP